jgi:RND superfamily putative drug exporter
VRLLLVPAVMHILGRVNWWMPAWLGRLLPELHVEGKAHEHLPEPEPELATV